MGNKRIFLVLTALLLLLTACTEPGDNRIFLGKAAAERQLEIALKDSSGHNVIDGKTVILKDSTSAISVAEPILFGMYGKDNITNQQPYEIHHLDSYWVIEGTLDENTKGGTFLIILDSRTGEVVRLTHGK